MTEKRLFIIEDEEKIAQLISRVATEAGFAVHTVTNFTAIPLSYENFKPHVIVLDILMPNMDGFEVLRFLHKRNSQARIVIMSGQDTYRPMAEKMAKGLNLDVADTITKPFRVAVLRKTLERISGFLPIDEAA